MKKMRCIICDDEPVARKILEEFVEQVPFMELTGKFENAIKAGIFLQSNQVDLLFLDIEMPRLSGLQFLKEADIAPLVVLTTAFPQYALEGYELDILDYLLKPFGPDELQSLSHALREQLQNARPRRLRLSAGKVLIGGASR